MSEKAVWSSIRTDRDQIIEKLKDPDLRPAMTKGECVRSFTRWTAAAAGLAAATYGVCVSAAWLRYGRLSSANRGEEDELLDRFMPVFDVA